MKLQDITNVLNFRAFRPEPDDSTATWTRRFPKTKTLLLNIGRKRVSWVCLDKRGDFSEYGSLDGEFKEILSQMTPDWLSMTENGWCAVSLNTRCMMSLEVNLSRRQGSENMLRTNPKSILGSKAERNKRYGLKHNPESNTSILLACEEDAITKAENQLKEVGLNVGRFSCGLYGMLLDLISQYDDARRSRSKEQVLGPVLFVACCEGSVVAMSQRDEAWLELRSRTDCYQDDMVPVLDIVLPLLQNCGPNTQVIYMGDNVNTGLPELMQSRMPGLQVSDVSVPHQLWKILADL